VKAAAAPDVFAAPMVTAEVVSPGVWYLAGQSHHSVLVEFGDYLALIEAPQNDLRTSAVLAKVKELKPDKPLRFVINTHHHFDHSGGIRRAIAEEGVTLITHESNKGFYEDIAQRPHTIMTDELSKSPKAPTVEGVTDKYVLMDSTRTIEIYPITGSPHAETLLMVYFPRERLIVEADVYSPPAEGAPPAAAYPFLANFVENVQKLNLRVDRLVPIHGRIVPWNTVLAAAAASNRTSE
jgi:glyoxylase-like metal-dependent hydrolase (beta-lactamase superfamily II)